jgi:hypothetical protein
MRPADRSESDRRDRREQALGFGMRVPQFLLERLVIGDVRPNA